jgi:hypothetical protein
MVIRIHGQVPNGRLGTAREGLSDDGAMALGVVAFIAQERDGAGGSACQSIEECALCGEVLTKIAEEAREVAILAQSVTDLPWRAQGTLMRICDPCLS